MTFFIFIRWALFVLAMVFSLLILRNSLSEDPHYNFIPFELSDFANTSSHYHERIVTSPDVNQVHSAAMAQTSSGGLRAFWFEGSREGARDVAVYSATLSEGADRWSDSSATISRESAQKELRRYVRKLGNPVAIQHHDGSIWLFYVSVGVGGWAGSSINYTRSNDDGETWSDSRKLITSPFMNISTLVKGAPLLLESGGILLPVYHEFLNKFGELLFISKEGKVVRKDRLDWGRNSLQPVVIPKSKDAAEIYMRYAGPAPRRVLQVLTDDGGRQWSAPLRTRIPNPNSAIAGLRLPDGSILLTVNNSVDKRDVLSLVRSVDQGKTWTVLRDIENESSSDGEHRFSYPSMLMDARKVIHVVYSWNRSQIRHVEFNMTYLNRLITDSVQAGTTL